MIDVEAVAWTLPLAEAGQRAVEAVAEPVQHDEDRCHDERIFVPTGQSIRKPGQQLRNEAESGEVIGRDSCRGTRREPSKSSAFDVRGQRLLDASGGTKILRLLRSGCDYRRRHIASAHCCVPPDLFSTAVRVAFKVNCRDSRGMLWTMGAISHPSPVGTSRVSEPASHSTSTPSL